ncbi:hypothetical protein CU098_010283 [Rhizopus stolonifer]|uniref:Uncharacterized protein n=1 Tax=Rhizopus stolonifer TaxID=4846 RepID=A0A367KP38_RHIST|nr:hypothetical protein CU098_010283 [Rhizopus stolonifer]
MASFFFEDYHFPSELYSRETGDFTTPVRTLLDFAPHILQELPKKEKEQKPINSPSEDSWTKNTTPTSYLGSLLTSERAHAIAEFVIRCGNEYFKTTEDKRRQEQEFKEFETRYKEQRQKKRGWFNTFSSTSDSEEETLEQQLKEKEEKEKQEAKRKKEKEDLKALAPHTSTSTMAKSAVAASVLSLSLYSTYQASVKFSEVSFHNQLEILITQVQSILQSTQVWIEEHDKLGDGVPNQIRSDVIQLKQIVDYLVRLDPRSNKKIEAAGWSFGALGGLSALGGLALGSATVATGGAALALGGVVVMISSKAQGKSQLGARLLLENQVRERVSSCQKAKEERTQLIEQGFTNQIKKEKTNSIEPEKEKPSKQKPAVINQEPLHKAIPLSKKKVVVPN